MSTRYLTVVRLAREYKVAEYGQTDGYPSGAGLEILEFLRNKYCLDMIRKNLPSVQFVTSHLDDELLDDDVDYLIHKPTPVSGFEILHDIYSFGNIELENSIEFAADSLLCEYAYVIDYDTDTFEIYSGLNNTPLSESDRFYFLKDVKRPVGYEPVVLAKKYDLNNLPSVEEYLADVEIIETRFMSND